MIIKIIGKLRGNMNRLLLPRSLKPLSSKFGFDRGKPVDRYWIDNFIKENSAHIKGSVLEITDPYYTKTYGTNVTKSDVLDIDKNNKRANIQGDLRNLKGTINDNQYDCVILTHVLGLIDDYEAAIKEIRRILKPEGVLIYTGSCLGPILGEEVYWRFTPNAVKYIFTKYFKPTKITISTYGNLVTGQAFWVGMSQEDLTKKELEYNDPRFPCAVGAIIAK